MKIPPIGFGTSPYRLGHPPLDVEPFVREAVAAGYRLFDVAEGYGNERAVGRALRDVPREELVIIGKVWPTNYRANDLRHACEGSLHRLGLDRFDFYLLHSPGAMRHIAPLEDAEEIGWDELIRRGTSVPDDVPLGETWEAMQRLVEDGRTTNIGVSNFNARDLDRLAGCAANEIPCWPLDPETIAAYMRRQIHVFGYSPLQRRDASPPEVIASLIRGGITPLTFSTNPAHIRENIAAARIA